MFVVRRSGEGVPLAELCEAKAKETFAHPLVAILFGAMSVYFGGSSRHTVGCEQPISFQREICLFGGAVFKLTQVYRLECIRFEWNRLRFHSNLRWPSIFINVDRISAIVGSQKAILTNLKLI